MGCTSACAADMALVLDMHEMHLAMPHRSQVADDDAAAGSAGGANGKSRGKGARLIAGKGPGTAAGGGSSSGSGSGNQNDPQVASIQADMKHGYELFENQQCAAFEIACVRAFMYVLAAIVPQAPWNAAALSAC